jgi:hypothetical protein
MTTSRHRAQAAASKAPERRRRSTTRRSRGRRTTSLALSAAALLAVAAPASASTSPALAGSIADSATLSGATAVAVAGHYAYVADYYAGRLSAIDISNPAAPFVAGSSQATNELLNASTVNIAGGYAFVVSKNRNGPLGSESNDDGSGNSLTVLDIATNPASPSVVGSIHDANTLFGAYGVAVSGHYAFVASQGCLSGQPCPNHAVGCAFAVIDIGSPGTPLIVAALHSTSLPSPWGGTGALGHVTSVAISGSYAYVTAAYQSRLTVINIANPLKPQIVASPKDTTNLAFPVDVALSGKYAYVINQSSPGRLTVLDVSNPASPQVVASLASSALSGGYRIRVRGDFAYVSASSAAGVAVVDISNPLAPRLLASVPDNAHLYKTTGLDLDPSGQYLVATSPFLSTQKQPLYPPYPLQPEGPTLTGTVSAIALDPSPISVSIAPTSLPENPTAQTSASFGFAADDAVATVRCRLDSGPWLPCTTPTGQSYAELTAGSHSFEAQATDAAGNTSVAAYSWVVTAPVNSGLPAISGSPVAGQTLSASTGTWSGSPSFAYQWLRCDTLGLNCAPIPGASSSSYALTEGDTESTLAVQVTASTSAGSTTAESPPTATIEGPPANLSPPSVSGTPSEGQTLSATAGAWSGYPVPTLTYQWERCDQNGTNCAPIGEANGSTYTPQAADAAATLAVRVNATNGSGTATASSAPTAPVTAPPANLTAPGIAGNAVEGQTLSASSGSWSGYPAPTLSYQWERCDLTGQSCAAILEATGPSYTALSADVGSTLLVTVSASNGVGPAAQARSSATIPVSSAAGPLTPLLDSFARPNNSGPPGPSWTHMVVSSSSASNDLYVTNQQVTGKSGSNADYWNPQTYGPNSEVWVTVATKPTADQDPVVLGLRFQNPGAANASGYQAYYIFRSSQPDQYKIIARSNGTTSTTLAATSGPTLKPGDELLFRALGTTLELWRLDSGVWSRILSATDATYQSAGYLSLTARDSSVRLTNFGGGTLP